VLHRELNNLRESVRISFQRSYTRRQIRRPTRSRLEPTFSEENR
jgi:hypothetical protein